jgi:hypothetical protein
LFTQQTMAQGQLEEMRRRRALEAAQGAAPPGAGGDNPTDPPSGYL